MTLNGLRQTIGWCLSIDLAEASVRASNIGFGYSGRGASGESALSVFIGVSSWLDTFPFQDPQVI